MKILKGLLLAFLAIMTSTSHASIVVTKDTSITDNIPGLTGITTTGAQMEGLKVTATFSGGLSQTLTWTQTSATSGGVIGNDWGLSLNGDSFTNAWQFAIGSQLGKLLTLVLDASGPNQVTIFDTIFDDYYQGVYGIGTPDSGLGLDFSCSGCNAIATYSHAVAVIPNAPFGDLFHVLRVDFTPDNAPSSNFSFSQDTDNDKRLQTGFVPEPDTIALMFLAMGCMGFALRRRT